MRRTLFTLAGVFLAAFALWAGPAARAEVPTPLSDAIQKLIRDEDHWAYTQQTQRFKKSGEPDGGPTIERYDPSLPIDEQWQLVQFSGHKPTEGELGKWRRQKERAQKHKGEKTFGDYLDLEHATLFSSAADRLTFLVPLTKNSIGRFPADKLEVFMNVDPAQHALTSFSLRPKGVFHMAGVIRVDGGEFEGRMQTIQPKYAPVFVWGKGSGYGKILGIFKVGMGGEVNLSDYKRVMPFNDRFDVKIGDIKALNF
jgi:hypothetical protein